MHLNATFMFPQPRHNGGSALDNFSHGRPRVQRRCSKARLVRQVFWTGAWRDRAASPSLSLNPFAAHEPCRQQQQENTRAHRLATAEPFHFNFQILGKSPTGLTCRWRPSTATFQRHGRPTRWTETLHNASDSRGLRSFGSPARSLLASARPRRASHHRHSRLWAYRLQWQ